MPEIQVDYMHIGYATTFRVPMFRYRKEELYPGCVVVVTGDGVDDQIATVDYWIDNNTIQLTISS